VRKKGGRRKREGQGMEWEKGGRKKMRVGEGGSIFGSP